MKNLLAAVLLISFSFFSNAQTATDFTIDDTNGNTLNLFTSLNQGNTVVVKFFTTWCSICNATAPQVQNLWEGYQSSPDNVLLWGIDRDNGETEQQVINYASMHSITYPEAAMGGSIASQYGVTYQPDYRIFCPDKTYYTTTNWNQVDGKVQQCLASVTSAEATNYDATLKLFPNPAENEVYLNFNLSESSEIEIVIYNQLGQEVKNIAYGQLESKDQTIKADLSGLSTGIYSLVLMQNETRFGVRSLMIR